MHTNEFENTPLNQPIGSSFFDAADKEDENSTSIKADSQPFNWDNVEDSVKLGLLSGATAGALTLIVVATVVGPFLGFLAASALFVGGACIGFLIGVFSELNRVGYFGLITAKEPEVNTFDYHNSF